MAIVEMSREYPAETQQLFAYLTDPTNWPRYYHNLVAAEPSRFAQVGDTAVATYRILGVESEVLAGIIEVVFGERLRFVGRTKGLPDTEQDWRYQPTPTGTRIDVTLTAPEPDSWLGRALDRLVIARQFEKDLARSLDNIGDLAVAGARAEPV